MFAARMDVTALRRIDETRAEVDRLAARRARVRITGGALVAAAPVAVVIATLAVVAPSAGSISGPVLGVLVLWPLAVIELVGTVNETAATLPSVAGSAHRVVSVLDTPDPVVAATTPIEIGPTPELTLAALTARWPNVAHDALGPVSLQLPFGSHATIVGPSGSGKSTLAAVLVGFLPPHHGAYRIDGVDALHVTGESLRRRITWIQQLPWLADSTVRENLRIADASADDAVLVAALDAVRLDTWFEHLPFGLDSRIGRGGSGMSGGEAQRLALARVLLADHRVVVLDEPTANLDSATAEFVLATVLERCGDRTTVVLGHGGQATG
jgi:ABC-type transport system involved in cytochrome bd biosynthesis fused ATPase/permease subunit